MQTWVIVGGGIQGVTVAIHLLEKNIATLEEITIIDPHDQPLSKWKQMTSRIDMPFLRSSFVHHVSSSPFSLDQFGKKYGEQQKLFLGRYHRPKLTLFNDHCDELIHTHKLENSWYKGTVNGLSKYFNSWQVTLESGETIRTKHIVLALGLSQQPSIPDQLISSKNKGGSIHHIFEEELNLDRLHPPMTIVGGGITAAHTAISLSNKYPGHVTLLKRHPFRVHSFDSDPGWLGPKNMHRFLKLTDYQQRRKSIFDARHRGSITRELYLKLRKREKTGELTIQTADISAVSIDEDKTITMMDEERDLIHKTRNVICCTGFHSSMPGGTWLQHVIQQYSLPCAQCGYPIVSKSLMWDDCLYVAGPLAELEVGPVARNISGAQKAAAKITANH
ncbi:FAD/NAD(P)-binding protein [Salipaludibacillus daqingensis]|uniref:FAD/NAD(P)-binding protein n=1 Tax=Salipaludibacillus daqingensis TaxID=3041001 RepID=UPI002474D942|nr:FAD/NAD(P)-binding protein [Salipaludibacillus daqingensis]